MSQKHDNFNLWFIFSVMVKILLICYRIIAKANQKNLGQGKQMRLISPYHHFRHVTQALH